MSEKDRNIDPDAIRERIGDSLDEETREEGIAEIQAMLAGYADEEADTETGTEDDPDHEPTEEELEGIFDESFGRLLDLIRHRSTEGELTVEADWVTAGLVPEVFSPEEYQLRVTSYLDDTEMAEELDYADIKRVAGSDALYHYSSDHMSENFARMAFLGSERDDIITFVEMVRADCRIYPRPLIYTSLMNHPLELDLDRIDAAFEKIGDIDEYADIEECYASNGDRYFYSTEYLSSAQAKSLAEWYSVERVRNP